MKFSANNDKDVHTSFVFKTLTTTTTFNRQTSLGFDFQVDFPIMFIYCQTYITPRLTTETIGIFTHLFVGTPTAL